MMLRAVATMMMTMTRINPYGGKDNAAMTTCINPSCTVMTMSNQPGRGNDNQGEWRHVCWLVLRLERAASNTKAYQSLLDAPSLPRNFITRNQTKLRHTQYAVILYPQSVLIPIQKQEQKPIRTITCLTQMCLQCPGPWAVLTTKGVVPLLFFARPVSIWQGLGRSPCSP
jgi:hypothetical protein